MERGELEEGHLRLAGLRDRLGGARPGRRRGEAHGIANRAPAARRARRRRSRTPTSISPPMRPCSCTSARLHGERTDVSARRRARGWASRSDVSGEGGALTVRARRRRADLEGPPLGARPVLDARQLGIRRRPRAAGYERGGRRPTPEPAGSSLRSSATRARRTRSANSAAKASRGRRSCRCRSRS